jgi:hypothetical protein
MEANWGNLKSQELANLCVDTIDKAADIAEDGLDRLGTDAKLRFAFLRYCGLRLWLLNLAGNRAKVYKQSVMAARSAPNRSR